MTDLPRTDVHQHLWPPELLSALERRFEPPFARFDAGTWRLHVPGEPAATVAAQEGADRAGGLAGHGVDRALLSLSTALQVEALAPNEAAPLLDVWRTVVSGLPSTLGAWGTLNLRVARPDDVDALLDEGFVGLCLPAGALAHPRRIERLAELLGRLEARDAPLFVHPGPAAGGDDAAPWWPALTSYTASLHAAWWAWAAVGLERHPRLRVVFAALAGLAPLHGERAATRGGPLVPGAPQLFYETSSYGPQAVALMRRTVGTAQLVHGSDVPVVRGAVPQDDEALLRTNPTRLLG
jgi:hypothetical protein